MSPARLLLLLGALLLAACAESATSPCDGACTAYQVCAEDVCVRRPCDDARRPCPENGVCVEGECQPDPAAFECLTDTDCDAGACIEGQCFAPECGEGEVRPCATACGEGTETCRAGVFRACSAPRPADVEACDDGRDDDCDGLTDEGCRGCALGATRPCATACGEGTEACVEDRWQGCSAPPVEAETCADGRDQDCDGQADEGCPACVDGERRACESACGVGEEVCADGLFAGCDAPAPVDGQCPDACPPEARRPDGEVRLDRGPDAAWFPEILHSGLEFVAVYDDHRAGPAGTTWVQRVAADGARRGDPVRVADRFLAAAVMAGDQIAVVTVETSRLSLSTVSRLGRLGGPPVALAALDRVALKDAAWTGDAVALIYDKFQQEGAENLYLARVDLQGRVIAQDTRLRATQRVLSATVQRLPSGYLLAWAEPHDGDPFAPDLLLARFNDAGRLQGSVRTLTRGRDAAFAAGPDGYGLAFVAHRQGQPDAVGFLRLAPDGAPAGAPTIVSDSPANARDPAIAYGDGRYGVVWVDARMAGPELWFRPLDAAGELLAPPAMLVSQEGRESAPVMTHADGRFGLSWFRERADGLTDVWFTAGPFLCEDR